MTDIRKTSDVLIEAKGLIADHKKWFQGDWSDGKDCFCSLGAVGKALGVDPDVMLNPNYSGWPVRTSRAGQALQAALRMEGVMSTVADFNDHMDRNHDEVIAMFDRAIAHCMQVGD